MKRQLKLNEDFSLTQYEEMLEWINSQDIEIVSICPWLTSRYQIFYYEIDRASQISNDDDTWERLKKRLEKEMPNLETNKQNKESMKVYVNGVLHDSEKEPIVMVWDTDEQRKVHAQNIASMPEKDGMRAYMSYPDRMDPDQAQSIMEYAVQLAGQDLSENKSS